MGHFSDFTAIFEHFQTWPKNTWLGMQLELKQLLKHLWLHSIFLLDVLVLKEEEI